MEKKLIVISAVWCPSCLVLNKQIKKIKENIDIDIIKYDYDLDEEEIEKYNVGNKLPVLVLEDNNGNEVNRLIGEKSIEDIIEFIGE